MLTIDIVEKRFKAKTILKEAEIKITKNGIYGIVGKNGQGKTTLFKCILGFEKYLGTCTIDDEKIILQDVAWCPAEVPIYDELSAAEFSQFYCNLLDIKNSAAANVFDVPQDQLIKEFSTGMKKKAYLNAVFQKKYRFYILDEPFNGLDIEANYALMNYLNKVAETSIVLISSHILDILFNNCEQIFILKNTAITIFEKDNFSKIPQKLFE
ncbi:ATP-binding cassette domain-containing protein [Flavobacterium algicola]|uniref:ATP-binding cassette domain-containing protein n=1 Tax=Flavobacterium algicola TaxID=556529 RepID=UPI001EFD63B5|nr:ATP-binding cassette domain-containing protein [Flavobacterium algicola]MCG9794016.1 ATP-binding cassette domain-containing protein [Flavobacterium algicola]